MHTNNDIRKAIGKFVLFQLVVIYVFAALFWGGLNFNAGKSALLGGGINAIATLYFAKQCFATQGSKRAKAIVNAFYKGEALKFLFIFAMFAMVFVSLDVEPAPFFLAYIVAQISQWAMPLFLDKVYK